MATRTPDLDMAVLPTQVVVTSESDPDTTYQVQLPYCPCKDYRWRRTRRDLPLEERFCKHLRKAIALLAGWHSDSEPEVHSGLTRTSANTLLGVKGVAGGCIAELLNGVHPGRPSFWPGVTGQRGEIKVEASDHPRRYTVTVYPVRY